DDSSVPIQLLIGILSFILSIIFACAENALDKLNDSELKKNSQRSGGKRFDRLLKISDDDTDYIEAMHTGKLFTLFVSVLCFFLIILNSVVLDLDLGFQILAVILYLAVCTLVSSVFVYLIPRHITTQDPIRTGTRLVGFIVLFRTLLFPFVRLNYYLAKAILRLFRVRITRAPEKITEDSIISMVNEGQESGVIGDEEREMISNVFNLDDKTAGDVMTHRTEICAVEDTDPLDKILDVACGERYSRIPVYRETVDNIIGIIHIKDLLRIDPATFKLENVLREAAFVPESQKLDEVLDVLRKNSTHLAVVVDEYGGTAGIVTMEDILEELVGNIYDEYDTEEEIIEEQEITQLGDDTYLVAGLTSIETVNEQLGVEIPDDEYGTVSGFVIGLLGKIPEEDTHPEADYKELHFTVESSNDKIITQLRIDIRDEAETEEEES
ncbi:MAG: HlyC/CorC family transporter, partial [Clostridia bacterium]|nr:HlyC/CorC family transporter [Clostridia bacterium]